MKSVLKIKKVTVVDRGIFYEHLHYTLLMICVNKKATQLYERLLIVHVTILTTNSFGLHGSLGGFTSLLYAI